MGTQSSPPPTRPGTPGLDIFKIAGKSISGYVPSKKTGDERQVRQPYMSTLEQRLLLYLEYHPHMQTFQRGDISPAFAQARHIHTPLGTPYRINYTLAQYHVSCHEVQSTGQEQHVLLSVLMTCRESSIAQMYDREQTHIL